MHKTTSKVKPRHYFWMNTGMLDDDEIQELPDIIARQWIHCLSIACLNGGRIPVEVVAGTKLESILETLSGYGLFAKRNVGGAAYVSTSKHARFPKRKTNIDEMRARASDGFLGGFIGEEDVI